MKGDQMGIRPAYPTPRELPLSNRTRFKLKYNRNERMQNIATEPTRRACRNIGDENAARSTKGSRARRSASTNKAKAAPVTTSGTTKADGALRTLPSPCSVKTEDVITPASRRQPAQSKAPDK